MKAHAHIVLLLFLAMAGNSYGFSKWFHGKTKKNAKQDSSATVIVDGGLSGCKVDIDGEGAGVTGSNGSLSVEGVDPGDHYLHVQCPGKRDTSCFISPAAGQRVQVKATSASAAARMAEGSPIAAAEARSELRRMVSQAVQLRASGQFKEAVELLRKATQLDPRNGDLHRELGITFLMFHDWERARVEMLEAVRREPDSVDAHSGLAYALEKLGDLDEALKQYRICTQMDPHDTSYRDHYVEVLGMMYTQKAQKKH
jgi:Tetratricopeptide repeat